MKRFLLIFAILLAGVSFVNAQSYIGSYKGLIDKITMRGNSYNDVPGQVFNLQNGKITGTVSKIGSMPGTISIDLNVSVDSNGNITATSETCGKLTVLGLIPVNLQLTSLTDAVVTNNTLEFTLACHGKYLGMDFPASIHFKSESFTPSN